MAREESSKRRSRGHGNMVEKIVATIVNEIPMNVAKPKKKVKQKMSKTTQTEKTLTITESALQKIIAEAVTKATHTTPAKSTPAKKEYAVPFDKLPAEQQLKVIQMGKLKNCWKGLKIAMAQKNSENVTLFRGLINQKQVALGFPQTNWSEYKPKA